MNGDKKRYELSGRKQESSVNRGINSKENSFYTGQKKLGI